MCGEYLCLFVFTHPSKNKKYLFYDHDIIRMFLTTSLLTTDSSDEESQQMQHTRGKKEKDHDSSGKKYINEGKESS
jgi:hypothetical protein